MGSRAIIVILVLTLASYGCSSKSLPVSHPSRAIGKVAIAAILVEEFPQIPQPVSLCVKSHVLTLRTGPGVSFQPVTWLPEGTEVTQLSSVGNWFEVTTSQYHGWVNSKHVRDCP